MVNQLSWSKKIFIYFITFGFFSLFAFLFYFYISPNSNDYYINFTSSINGLKVGSAVTYKGVNVGVVNAIKIDSMQDVVNVKIKIVKNFVVYSDYYAICNMQGVSGLCFIDLYRYKNKEHVPLKVNDIIASDLSSLEKLNLFLEKILALIDKQENYDKENLEKIILNVTKFIENIKEFSEFLNSDNCKNLIANIGVYKNKLDNEIIPKVNDTIDKIDDAVKEVQNSRLYRCFIAKNKTNK